MTSSSGTLPFLASPAQRVALQETAQRMRDVAGLRSQASHRVMEPVVSTGDSPVGGTAAGESPSEFGRSATPSISPPGLTPAAAEGAQPASPQAEAQAASQASAQSPSKTRAKSEPFNGVRRQDELSPEEQKQVEALKERDQEVRTHEAAHKAAGGQYVRSGATFDYQTGPDGKRYAIGGEVKIDTGKEDDPQKTLEKAETIRRAAMAPAEPSDKDRQVAADAARMAAEARTEIAEERAAEARGEEPEDEEGLVGEVMGREEQGREGRASVGVNPIGDEDEGGARGFARGATGAAAYGAVNQFNATANAGRSTNLFVNVYA